MKKDQITFDTVKMKIAAKTIIALFKMHDLYAVLKSLKSNKARDPEGIERIIFKSSIIGTNIKNVPNNVIH